MDSGKLPLRHHGGCTSPAKKALRQGDVDYEKTRPKEVHRTMQETAIIEYAPSLNSSLATALTGLEAQLQRAAECNIRAMTNDGDGFTQAELRAMKTIEEL